MSVRIKLDGETFELTPEVVRARLAGQAPGAIRDYWVEIDGARWPVKQVIALAIGVSDRQRFQSQSARRWLHNLGFTVFSAQGGTAPATGFVPPKPPKVRSAHKSPGTPADVVLVGCVKSKRQHGAPAKDLYVSDYFTKMRSYAESSGQPWYILSAEHGLVHPDQWLEPYERYLPSTTRDYRQEWGRRVVAQLAQAMGSLHGLVLDIHAGAAYVEAIEQELAPTGAHVIDQLRGLSFGRRLSWYLEHDALLQIDGRPVIAQLRDEALARSLDDIVATGGAGLMVPGLYSWWVDEAGASDLTTGLGQQIDAGLIYAGHAGATRKGGSSSSNTLWGRIATMHLGKRHGFSTLRFSLGSILAHTNGRPVIDEVQLTRWMHAHLRIVTIPVADADTLDALETQILRELDPPLNLAKVDRTPLRRQLSALRKQYGGAAAKDGGAE